MSIIVLMTIKMSNDTEKKVEFEALSVRVIFMNN